MSDYEEEILERECIEYEDDEQIRDDAEEM